MPRPQERHTVIIIREQRKRKRKPQQDSDPLNMVGNTDMWY